MYPNSGKMPLIKTLAGIEIPRVAHCKKSRQNMVGAFFGSMVEHVLKDRVNSIIPGMSSGELAFKLHCNSPMIKAPGVFGGSKGMGSGFYTELLEMTRVCGDNNCMLLFDGKKLVVKALDDIPNYRSPSDVSLSEEDLAVKTYKVSITNH